MLSEREKSELREMAASATLRQDFRTLRRYSQQLERQVSIDDYISWLSAMTRLLPMAAKPRGFLNYNDAKF